MRFAQRVCEGIGSAFILVTTALKEGEMPHVSPRLSRDGLWVLSRSLPGLRRVAICATAALVCAAASGLAENPFPIASAPVSAGQPDPFEMEQTLYVQAPDFAGAGDSIVLVWLPEPLESTCLGRTMKECARIDYCIRTTNPDGPQCKNLPIPRSRLPHYPPDMQPRRAISVVLRALGNGNGFDKLKAFYRSADPASLSRISPDATIRARIRYNNNPSFEGFTLLEVLAAP